MEVKMIIDLREGKYYKNTFISENDLSQFGDMYSVWSHKRIQ